MGSMFLYIVVGPVIILLIKVAMRIRCDLLSKLRIVKILAKLVNTYFSDSVTNIAISFVYSNYIVLTIVCLIQMTILRYDTWSQ
jgi:hypothetical protein